MNALRRPLELPVDDREDRDIHVLEPHWRRLPIGTDHVLYPLMVGIALIGILIGGSGRRLADDMPEDKTHPWFPDHFWPYPILAVALLATLGMLAAFGQQSLQLDGSADPRAGVIARPDWYFLFLFQLLKLGPDWLTSLVIPAAALAGVMLWPFIDSSAGPRLARRLGWKTWPVPGRNVVTGTLLIAMLGLLGLLTLWALLAPQLCIPWFANGPVCGA